MFYGLTKNKNGGTIPELEKYEPWDNEVFSGKIVYQLDDGETYEVYRDFKKKNPKIFNQNLEEISQHFTIDKTKGNQFFYDQIGLEEEIFTSSIITKQANVRLDEKTQNTVVQKISNILGTGEDTLSYTTMVNKIKKQLNDEVGTANTKERPINIVNSKIETLSKEKIELQSYQKSKFDIEKRINEEKEKNKRAGKRTRTTKKSQFPKRKIKRE